MKLSWLFSWDKDRGKPTIEFNPDDKTISFATFPDNPDSFVIFEGYLFDKQNYQIGLDSSDAQRVIEYYTLFGEDLFVQLRGGYSLVIWDHAERQLIAGRDHTGVIPFYFFNDHKRTFISSNIHAIHPQPEVSRAFNRVLIAERLLFLNPDQQLTETFFERISRLPPAHYLKQKDQRFSTNRYWDPLPIGFEWATEEESAALLDVFQQAVNRCLNAGADSVSLSGGLDSVSIAVMAAKIQRENDELPLHAVSGKHPGTGADDGPIQMAIAQKLGMPQTLLTIEEIMSGEPLLQASLNRFTSSPLPCLSPTGASNAGLMRIAAKEKLNKIMYGIGGDEMFLVNSFLLPDLLARAKFRTIFNLYRIMDMYDFGSDIQTARRNSRKRATRYIGFSLLRNAKCLIIPPKKPSVQFPPWLTESDKPLLEAIQNRHRETWLAQTFPQDGYYPTYLRKALQNPLAMHMKENNYFNVRQEGYTCMFPYNDPDLIQLGYRINPEQNFEGGLVKAPLQRFLIENDICDGLPPRKTDYGPSVNLLVRSEGKNLWNTIRKKPILYNLGIINLSNVENFMRGFFESKYHDYGLVWKLLSTEVWLESQS